MGHNWSHCSKWQKAVNVRSLLEGWYYGCQMDAGCVCERLISLWATWKQTHLCRCSAPIPWQMRAGCNEWRRAKVSFSRSCRMGANPQICQLWRPGCWTSSWSSSRATQRMWCGTPMRQLSTLGPSLTELWRSQMTWRKGEREKAFKKWITPLDIAPECLNNLFQPQIPHQTLPPA